MLWLLKWESLFYGVTCHVKRLRDALQGRRISILYKALTHHEIMKNFIQELFICLYIEEIRLYDNLLNMCPRTLIPGYAKNVVYQEFQYHFY